MSSANAKQWLISGPYLHAFKQPLQWPYDGPFRVLPRKGKHRSNVAYTGPSFVHPIRSAFFTCQSVFSDLPRLHQPTLCIPLPLNPPLMRSGRHVRFPERYQLVHYS
nr:unnamed protein product [Spirometra erinaceieuropaei]